MNVLHIVNVAFAREFSPRVSLMDGSRRSRTIVIL